MARPSGDVFAAEISIGEQSRAARTKTAAAQFRPKVAATV